MLIVLILVDELIDMSWFKLNASLEISRKWNRKHRLLITILCYHSVFYFLESVESETSSYDVPDTTNIDPIQSKQTAVFP